MSEASPGVPYANARVKREADDVLVLTTIASRPGRTWGSRDVWEALPALTEDRVRAALTRLTMRGEIQQARTGQAKHFHWWLRTPLSED